MDPLLAPSTLLLLGVIAQGFLASPDTKCTYVPIGSSSGRLMYNGTVGVALRFLPDQQLLVDDTGIATSVARTFGGNAAPLTSFFTSGVGDVTGDGGVKRVIDSTSAVYVTQQRFEAALAKAAAAQQPKLELFLSAFYIRALFLSQLPTTAFTVGQPQGGNNDLSKKMRRHFVMYF